MVAWAWCVSPWCEGLKGASICGVGFVVWSTVKVGLIEMYCLAAGGQSDVSSCQHHAWTTGGKEGQGAHLLPSSDSVSVRDKYTISVDCVGSAAALVPGRSPCRPRRMALVEMK